MQHTLNWKEISAQGLLERINREVMQPMFGIAVYEYPEDGIIADNGAWEYSRELTENLLHTEDVVESVTKLLAQEGYIENTNS